MTRKVKIILITVIVLFITGMAIVPRLLPSSPDGVLQTSDKKTGEGGKNTSREPFNVNALIVKPKTLNDVFQITGVLIPDEEVDLSFETSGQITNIYFQEGTQVKKGDLLAKVNDKPLQAELQKLNAQLPLAEDRVFRQKSLLAKDAVSQEAFESVNTELEKLKADIALMKARITQTELRAPFDGMIGLRLVSEGTYASPATIVSHLTKIIPLKLEFSINEQYVNDITPGTRATFTLNNGEEIYGASVYAVESKLAENTLTLKARARYPNLDGRLKPGLSANVEIKLREIKNTIAVPSMSTIAEMGRTIGYVYRSGKASQVILQKGLRTASSVQIVSGLNIGDTLLVSGVMQLRDGMPVVIDSYVDNPM
ncbi:MAG: efflux RND transporter periplasmic adaptor subunit [Bacteroidales bacterium]|jgi:membrane fusion protein (multidrug efflux system)|nr:efflux RND transporter periplasmic adaptor subunit [Bacteroidales bacterium]